MKKLISLLTIFSLTLSVYCQNSYSVKGTVSYPAAVGSTKDNEMTTRDRERLVRDAMRKGVVVMPLHTSPDDYINPGSTTDRSLPEELQKMPWYKRLDCYTLNPEQIKISRSRVSHFGVTAMQNTKTETLVTFTLRVLWDRQWQAFNKYMVMVDPATGDRYFPRRMENSIPFDKVLVINGCLGSNLDFTVVYPLLDSKVQKVIFTDDRPIQTEIPLNSAPQRDYVVSNVPEMLMKSEKKGRDIF